MLNSLHAYANVHDVTLLQQIIPPTWRR